MSLKTWSHADWDLDNVEPLFPMFVPESDALVEYSRLESKLRRDNVNEGEDLSLRVAEKRECTGILGGTSARTAAQGSCSCFTPDGFFAHWPNLLGEVDIGPSSG